MNIKFLFSSISLFYICAPIVHAVEVIAECGSINGHAFYPARGLVPDDKSGWGEDKITGGNVIFIRESSGDINIIMKTAAGITKEALIK